MGFVSPAWPPAANSNGIVTYVAGIRAGLSAQGIESSVFANRMDANEADDDLIDVTHFKPPALLDAAHRAHEFLTRKSAMAWRLGRRIGAAVRETHRSTPLCLLEMEETFGAAWYVRRMCPVPLVVRLHGPWLAVGPAMGVARDSRSLERERLEGLAILAADAVSSPSRYSLERVREHYGIELPDAVVIPNPVARLAPEHQWRIERCDRRSILFVGRFDRLKGGDLVIDAFRIVARERPEAELLFVGPDRGLLNETGSVQSLPEYVHARLTPDVAARVRMLGHQSPALIRNLRQRSLVAVVASRFENFPMTVLEALGCGSPLVAASVGGIPEIVTGESNGLLFAGGDSGELARQLLRIFGDPGLARSIGETGVRDAEVRFAPAVVARQTSAFYGRVMGRRHD